MIDNNGLLKDGSVVIRDNNRIVKGKLYIDNTNNNLVISSFLGGGLRILPNGSSESPGALVINPNTVISLRDKETGKVLAGSVTEIINKYVDKEVEKIISKEISDKETANCGNTDCSSCSAPVDEETGEKICEYRIKLTDEEKKAIREEVESRPLLRQEIMQSRYEYVTEQVLDGYAMYNGQFNTSDEIYVYKTSSEEIDGHIYSYTDKYKVIHEGDLLSAGSIDIDDGDLDQDNSGSNVSEVGSDELFDKKDS